MKDIDEAQYRLQGLFNIAVTPFTDNGDVDFAALAENLERMLSFGVNGFLIGGTYGEFATMSASERSDVFRHVTDVVGDRVPVMLCTASANPREARELTQYATQLGGVPMLTPPFVSEVTDEHIVGFFADMASQCPTGIVIYNAPGVGVTLDPAILERLAELPTVIGLKQGDLSPTAVDRIANRLRGRIRLFCASDLGFIGPLMSGFDGLSSTNSCGLPELITDAFRALQSGDGKRAGELHGKWFAIRELARKFGQPQTVKAIMRMRGWKGGHVRAPLIDLTESQLAELAAALSATFAEMIDRHAA